MKTILLIAVQILAGLLMVSAVYVSGIGNGWELVTFPLVQAAAATAVGILIQRTGDGERSPTLRLFVGALIVSALATSLLLIPRAWGMLGLLLPIAGAVIGYQIAART